MTEAKLNPIEAKECTIRHVFSDLYAYEIPPYQRPYAWELDQTRELLDDLIDAMSNKAASGGVYFLGSIVLIKSPGDPRSQVVDGQQRLTTLTILLSVLRDMTTDSEMRFNRSTFIFQKANPDTGAEERYRLLLRKQDQAFFRDKIQQPDVTRALPDPERLQGSQKRIAENASYLRNRLQQIDEGQRNDLVAFIMQNCYLIVVSVPTQETARRVFTVLNARGLDLTATDILKASFLERAGKTRETELATRWEEIERVTGRDGFVELFGHVRMIFERDKPRIALEVGFPKVVVPFAGDAERFISDLLEPIADAAALLADPAGIKKHFGERSARAVRSLERIDNKDWMPPALSRLWRRANDGKDREAVATFLMQLERLAYFLLVTRAGINERIARYASVLDELDPREESEPSNDGLELSGAEQTEFVAALDGPLYTMTRVCKPVLQRLDEALSAGGASYDELVSIEHVLPQTVEEGTEWARLFPNPVEREQWMHRIANLVFLTKRINSRASNWDFNRKKREYFASEDGSSPFVLTQGVLQTYSWSLEHLRQRQEKLVSTLTDVWQLKPMSAISSTSAALCTGTKKAGGPGTSSGHPNLFLVPASEENLRRTILTSLRKDIVAAHLTSEEMVALNRATSEPGVHCWAMTETRARVFDEMLPGDIVLFSQKGTGKFNYIARVIFKVDNEALGKKLWSFIPGEPWRLIYFVEQVEQISVDKTRLVSELGYNANYDVPGVIYVTPKRLTAALGRYGGTIMTFIEALQHRS